MEDTPASLVFGISLTAWQTLSSAVQAGGTLAVGVQLYLLLRDHRLKSFLEGQRIVVSLDRTLQAAHSQARILTLDELGYPQYLIGCYVDPQQAGDKTPAPINPEKLEGISRRALLEYVRSYEGAFDISRRMDELVSLGTLRFFSKRRMLAYWADLIGKTYLVYYNYIRAERARRGARCWKALEEMACLGYQLGRFDAKGFLFGSSLTPAALQAILTWKSDDVENVDEARKWLRNQRSSSDNDRFLLAVRRAVPEATRPS